MGCATTNSKNDLFCNPSGTCAARFERLGRWAPEHGAAHDFELEIRILPTEGSPRPDTELPATPVSLASLRSAQHDEKERRDDRIETIAVAISLFLLISGLVAILATVLLSRS